MLGKPSRSWAVFICTCKSCSLYQHCTAGKPSLNLAVKDKACFPFTSNVSIHYVYSLGQHNKPSLCTSLKTEEHMCVVHNSRSEHWPCGRGGARASGVPAMAQRGVMGAQGGFGQLRRAWSRQFNPSVGCSSQTFEFWGY